MSDDDSCSSCEMMIDIGGAEDDFDEVKEEENEKSKAIAKQEHLEKYKSTAFNYNSSQIASKFHDTSASTCASEGKNEINKEPQQPLTPPPPPAPDKKMVEVYTPQIEAFLADTGKYACSVECCNSSMHSDA
jgi:hypothetical protein